MVTYLTKKFISETIVPNKNSISRNSTRRFRTRSNPNSQVVSVRNDNFPRQFTATVNFNHRFRFSVSSTSSIVVTRAALLNMMMVGVSSTSLNRIVAAVKLNQLTLYGIGISSATVPIGHSTVSVEWLSDLGTTAIKSDTGTSIEPAKVVSGPPINSRASFWSRTGYNESEALMRLELTAGNIVDFDLSIVLYNNDTPVAISATSVTVGQLYVPSISSNLVPVSYPTV